MFQIFQSRTDNKENVQTLRKDSVETLASPEKRLFFLANRFLVCRAISKLASTQLMRNLNPQQHNTGTDLQGVIRRYADVPFRVKLRKQEKSARRLHQYDRPPSSKVLIVESVESVFENLHFHTDDAYSFSFSLVGTIDKKG